MRLLTVVSMFLAGLVLLGSVFFAGEFVGYESGIDAVLTSGGKERLQFGDTHINVYQTIFNRYMAQAILMSIFLFGSRMYREVILPNILVLVLLLFPIVHLVFIKHDLIAREVSYGGLMKNTLAFDYFCLISVTSLIVLTSLSGFPTEKLKE